jgi:CubicO group peptidase (beta-lactamase class C family)
MGKAKKITRFAGVFLLSLLVISTMAWAQDVNVEKPESVGISSEILTNIDKLGEQALKEKLLKGAIVLVARHGKICYFKAFGEADEGKAMQKDAIFRLASMTKPVTVAALMQFWDQGRFELKDPVSKYIPEFKDLKVAEMDSNGQIKLVPAKRQVTIHDLLSFTGGISATYMAALSPVHKYVAEEYAKAGVQDLMSETYTKNLEENVKALTKCPLIFQPGESWCYNQGGMDTLAYLVEIFSGKPFDKYLAENIFTPLKINEMWFYPPEDKFSRIPAVYDKPGTLEKVTKEWAAGTGVVGPLYTFGKNKAYFSAGGGLHGTTYDYYKFAQMMLNKGELDGVRILSRQAIEVMTTVQVGDGPQYRNLFSKNQWGYGVDIQANAKMSALNDWYGGPGSYGWRGFFSTMYFNNPAEDTVVMTMAQTPRHGYSWGCKVNQAAGAALLD